MRAAIAAKNELKTRASGNGVLATNAIRKTQTQVDRAAIMVSCINSRFSFCFAEFIVAHPMIYGLVVSVY